VYYAVDSDLARPALNADGARTVGWSGRRALRAELCAQPPVVVELSDVLELDEKVWRWV